MAQNNIPVFKDQVFLTKKKQAYYFENGQRINYIQRLNYLLPPE
jgi:hypothetical protein